MYPPVKSPVSLRSGSRAVAWIHGSIWRPFRPRLMQTVISRFSSTVEEETHPHYSPLRYYPIRIPQTLNNRYDIKAKLGYGGSSTVWLATDQKDKSYKVVKVSTNDTGKNELAVAQHLKTRHSGSIGEVLVRQHEDSFDIHHPEHDQKSPGNPHICFVYEPLGISLNEYLSRTSRTALTVVEVKYFGYFLAQALAFLHANNVVHTDLKLANIQLALPDEDREQILSSVANTSPTYEEGKHGERIYHSVPMVYDNMVGPPVLCDLGTARFGKEQYEGLITPTAYRAPEVLIGMEWNSKVDVWSLGIIFWELLTGELLFGNDDRLEMLPRMSKLLGFPPEHMLRIVDERPEEVKAQESSVRGKTKLHEMLVAKQEQMTEDDAKMAVDLISRMLVWDPAERLTAHQILAHDWLKEDSS